MFTATVLKTLSMATASATLMTLGVVSLTSSSVQATPLRLDYTVEAEDEGWFKYDFELSVDNNDGSYEPEQSWRWIVLGDAPSGSSSPLTDWIGDLANSSPWISSFKTTTGSHNGVTLYGRDENYPNGSVLADWTPTGVDDSLFWSGKSTANLQQGELLFSTLLATKPETGANFEVARRLESETPALESETLANDQIPHQFESSDPQPVPESTSVLGLLMMAVLGRPSLRKRQTR
ncbi:MAG: hypothetical protein RIB93_02975 [Coleofasciculus sp. D1-CHI-01]|uniref:hypothetical protein n=1 Tax=Coleofasciculus sp. D1-CHI-01 TaxID=3068482 RepID=UPI0032FF632F